MSDDLSRFIEAQAPVVDAIHAELAAGRKRTHWMWFVFPQLRGLGHSAMAQRFGLASRAEASAYLAHPVLGPRLRANVAQVLAVEGRTAHEIFGSPDDLKLRSCLTLFRDVDDEIRGEPDSPRGVFDRALERFFGGRPDPATLQRLAPTT